MKKVFGHTCSIISHANGWSNSFAPLLFCKLSSNHSISQDRHKRGVECIQIRGFVTLSTVHLSGEFLVDMGNIIQDSSQGIA